MLHSVQITENEQPTPNSGAVHRLQPSALSSSNTMVTNNSKKTCDFDSLPNKSKASVVAAVSKSMATTHRPSLREICDFLVVDYLLVSGRREVAEELLKSKTTKMTKLMDCNGRKSPSSSFAQSASSSKPQQAEDDAEKSDDSSVHSEYSSVQRQSIFKTLKIEAACLSAAELIKGIKRREERRKVETTESSALECLAYVLLHRSRSEKRNSSTCANLNNSDTNIADKNSMSNIDSSTNDKKKTTQKKGKNDMRNHDTENYSNRSRDDDNDQNYTKLKNILCSHNNQTPPISTTHRHNPTSCPKNLQDPQLSLHLPPNLTRTRTSSPRWSSKRHLASALSHESLNAPSSTRTTSSFLSTRHSNEKSIKTSQQCASTTSSPSAYFQEVQKNERKTILSPRRLELQNGEQKGLSILPGDNAEKKEGRKWIKPQNVSQKSGGIFDIKGEEADALLEELKQLSCPSNRENINITPGEIQGELREDSATTNIAYNNKLTRFTRKRSVVSLNTHQSAMDSLSSSPDYDGPAVSSSSSSSTTRSSTSFNTVTFDLNDDDTLRFYPQKYTPSISSAPPSSSHSHHNILEPIELQRLRDVIFGSDGGVRPSGGRCPRLRVGFSPSWQQGLYFTDNENIPYGLEQKEGGPCGAIAAVQAWCFVVLQERARQRFEYTKRRQQHLPSSTSKEKEKGQKEKKEHQDEILRKEYLQTEAENVQQHPSSSDNKTNTRRNDIEENSSSLSSSSSSASLDDPITNLDLRVLFSSPLNNKIRQLREEILLEAIADIIWTAATAEQREEEEMRGEKKISEGDESESTSPTSTEGVENATTTTSTASRIKSLSPLSSSPSAILVIPSSSPPSIDVTNLFSPGVLSTLRFHSRQEILHGLSSSPHVTAAYRNPKGVGVCLLLLSAALSRGLENVCLDADREEKQKEDEDTTAKSSSLSSSSSSSSCPIGSCPATAGLVVHHNNHCSQELVNLLIYGKAVSNVFDGQRRLGSDEDDNADKEDDDANTISTPRHRRRRRGKEKERKTNLGILLKGISHQCAVGFLSLFEANGCLQVGENLKTPKYPVWIISAESHYSILFSPILYIHSLPQTSNFLTSIKFATMLPPLNSSKTTTIDLRYYDPFAHQDELYHLIVTTQKEIPTISKNNDEHNINTSNTPQTYAHGLIPPLDQCIRTKWKGAHVDWTKEEPLL